VAEKSASKIRRLHRKHIRQNRYFSQLI